MFIGDEVTWVEKRGETTKGKTTWGCLGSKPLLAKGHFILLQSGTIKFKI